MLDPASLLSRNQTGANVVLVRFEDWQRYGERIESACAQADSKERTERNVRDLAHALKAAAGRAATPYVVCPCPASPAALARADLAAFFDEMEELLAAELDAASGVYVVRAAALNAAYPVASYYDARGDELGHIPFTQSFFTALGTMLARKVYALKSAPHKVIALDCDQTLWKGVCGEDGIWGIEIDSPRRALQEFMVAQHDAGMLLCLCSKNNEEDVVKVFEQRTDMPLKWEHVVSHRINWRPKSENIKSLAEELKLGLDSFIFIDDDPVVCAEVEANCPEVLTLQLPQDPNHIPRFLNCIWAFDHLKVTAEDRKRAILYKQNAQREAFRSQSLSFADFLAGLCLKVKISEMESSHLARVSQLTHRTNQFNFTTIRRSEGEIQSLCQSGLQCLTVEVSDRFGDYGRVGVMMIRCESGAVSVDTFLLSCRVLGKGVEHQMVARLGEIAKERGCDRVEINFIPSGKNQPAREFLEKIGSQFQLATDNGRLYRLPAAFAASLTPAPVAPEEKVEHGSATTESAPSVRAASTDGQSKSALFRRLSADLYDTDRVLQTIESQKRRELPRRNGSFAAPRDTLELQLVKIWEDVLATQPIGVADNFFDLGGQSLVAVRLFAEIDRVMGRNLPITTLLQAPTVEQLAALLRQADTSAPAPSLVPIQPQGSRPPLFCIHAGGANVLFYRDLAARLGQEQPVYGLQPQGLDGKCPRHERVEDMAAHYIKEIRAVQPAGPYFLAGACFGGLVAFEMAQQLRTQGQEAALVALFDTNGPGYPRLRPVTRALRLKKLYGLIRRVEHHFTSLFRLPSQSRLGYLQSKASKAVRLMRRGAKSKKKEIARKIYETARRPLPPSLGKTQKTIRIAQASYVPQVYQGRVVLFRASKQPLGIYPDPTMGWSGLVAGGLQVHDIPGTHGAIVTEPYVGVLAEVLQSYLGQAQPAQGKSASPWESGDPSPLAAQRARSQAYGHY